jgi:hypothetical protein
VRTFGVNVEDSARNYAPRFPVDLAAPLLGLPCEPGRNVQGDACSLPGASGLRDAFRAGENAQQRKPATRDLTRQPGTIELTPFFIRQTCADTAVRSRLTAKD